VETYGRLKRAVLVVGISQRSVAQEFGLARVAWFELRERTSVPPDWCGSKKLRGEQNERSRGSDPRLRN
jgi:hypothetical protein